MSQSTLCVLSHATPSRNLRSIQAWGLNPAFARDKLLCVWLHKPSRSAWAVGHCADRHGADPPDMAVIRLAVPRGWLKRNRRGIWTCDRVIPSECFISIRLGRFAAA
jgi:hypothetical protein